MRCGGCEWFDPTRSRVAGEGTCCRSHGYVSVEQAACGQYEPPRIAGTAPTVPPPPSRKAWFIHPESDCFFIEDSGYLGDGLCLELGPATTGEPAELWRLLQPGYLQELFLRTYGAPPPPLR